MLFDHAGLDRSISFLGIEGMSGTPTEKDWQHDAPPACNQVARRDNLAGGKNCNGCADDAWDTAFMGIGQSE
jgi:hypothetical protein